MRTGTLLLAVLIAVLGGNVLFAQDEGSAESSGSGFELVGTSRVEAQYSDQQGVGSDVPAKYARWELNPTFIAFDVPFSAALLLSTEQSRGRQSINSFNLSFSLSTDQLQERLRRRLLERLSSSDVSPTIDRMDELASIEAELNDPARLADIERLEELEESGTADSAEIERLRSVKREYEELTATYRKLDALRDKVGEADEVRRAVESGAATEKMYDPEKLRGALNEFELLSGVEKVFYNFPRFGVGVNYPFYTPFTMNGVPVNGVDFIFNPGKFYLAATAGRAQREVPEFLANDSTYIAYDREIFAGRLGYGRPGEGFVILTGMFASDGQEALIVDTLSGLSISPQENYVLGLEVDIPIVPEIFRIRGEINGSLLTGDLTSPGISSAADSGLGAPAWLVDFFGLRTSSFFDYALSIEPRLDITSIGTRVQGKYQRIGPGYVTLGIPYLRNDLSRIEVRGEQKLWRKQVTLSGSFRNEKDNLIQWKRATTTTTAYSAGLGLTFRNLPFLRLTVSPYTQKNSGGGEINVDNRIMIFNALAGYRYRFGESIGAMTTGSFSLQDVATIDGRFDSETKTYSLGQSVSIGTWLNLSATGSLSQPTSVVDVLHDVTTLDLSGTVTFLQDWSASLGGTLIAEEDASDKVGYRASLFIPISPIGSTFELTAARNVYDAVVVIPGAAADYEETVVRATILTQW